MPDRVHLLGSHLPAEYQTCVQPAQCRDDVRENTDHAILHRKQALECHIPCLQCSRGEYPAWRFQSRSGDPDRHTQRLGATYRLPGRKFPANRFYKGAAPLEVFHRRHNRPVRHQTRKGPTRTQLAPNTRGGQRSARRREIGTHLIDCS